MARRKVTVDERSPRVKARIEIVQAVNRFKVRFHAWHPYAPVLFSQRHIERAVRIARHHVLVKPQVLVAAGFRHEARR